MTRARVWLVGAACVLSSARALPHHLEVSRLELRPLFRGQLRGRLLLAPRAFDQVKNDEARLLSELGTALELSLDGQPCNGPLTLVELWTDASPSPGHLVDLECPAPGADSPVTLVVGWHAPSELEVTYPATRANPPQSKLLREGGRATFSIGSAASPPNTFTPERPAPQQTEAPALALGTRAWIWRGAALCLAALGAAIVLKKRIRSTRRPAQRSES